jgi:hypothetical protein
METMLLMLSSSVMGAWVLMSAFATEVIERL